MEHAKEPELQLRQLLQQLSATPKQERKQRFISYFEESKDNSCGGLEDFAIYYLAAVRQHTDVHFRSNPSTETDTPKCLTPVHKTKPPNPTEPEMNESLLSNLSIGNVSTPVRHQGRRSAGQQHCSTPQSTDRSTNRSSGGGGAGGSFCLGDFIMNATPNQSHQQRPKKKTTPQPQENPNNKSQKPRRRVLPMTISKNVSNCSSFGDTSSFSNENNLLRLSQSCELDSSQGAALEQEARKTLLLRKQEIKSEAPVASVEQEREREEPATVEISLEQVMQPEQLQLLAVIYAQLMDANLVSNVLSELSYVMQLLNIRSAAESPPTEEQTLPLSLLSRHRECIYFAAQLLEQQKELLLQLDRKSLTVLLQHERMSLLTEDLQQALELCCQGKQHQQQSKQEVANNSHAEQQNVYYQHEKDSRENFPSQSEFGAFKTQRDLFYKALKHWQTTHLNRMFNFGSELGPRVRDIFKQSEHAVNMAHFAQLFVSQLLMSSGETHESPEELGLKLDQQRLNRLAQRLVTSNSSVEDQFPRTQAFFRDFISGCGSVAFLVQLQMALYVQLMRHNDSSFELQQLQPNMVEEEEQQLESELVVPYVVRPQAMAELLMLAKFLGYVCALPYNRAPCSTVCPLQLQLRRQFQAPFELRPHLERAMQQGKLLITLPWLVQYLTMLDLVTLQLPGSLAVLELLYALYREADMSRTEQSLQPSALFIIRSSLGWLLESQPTLSSGYYTQRSTGAQLSDGNGQLVKNCLRGLRFVDKGKVLPLLEDLLTVACPFLHEFRVSITPSQRQSQRNGRYRYITTRLEQLSSGKNQPQQSQPEKAGIGNSPASTTVSSPSSVAEQQQRKLTEAFLHSQNPSMRRLLEFVTERSFKCVVKDAQQRILLPSKSAADAKVNELESINQQEVLRTLQSIYQQARADACQQWDRLVPEMLDKRITESLSALLPENTNSVVRSTFAHLIRQQANTQLQQWLQSSVLQSTFYHGDLQEVASKICRANQNNSQIANSGDGGTTNEMCLTDAGNLSLSELLHELQKWVHCLSLRPEHLSHMEELPQLLKRTRLAVGLSKLPTYFYQLIGSIIVRLLQLLICRQPQLISPKLMSSCCEIWLSPQLHPETAAPEFCAGLLSVYFVRELGVNLGSFQLLQQLLNAMLDARVLNVDELNQFFMPLFKENWPPGVWNSLSQLLQNLSKNRSAGESILDDDGKSNLFMEMLADLSQDLDTF